MSNLLKFNPEIRDTIIESGGEDAIKCFQCGRCMAACPWNLFGNINYTTYRLCQRIRLGAIIDSEDRSDILADTNEVYRCIGCNSCRYECPRGVNLSDVLRAIRRILVDYDSYPGELKSLINRLYNTGNPFGEAPERRGAWADALGIQRFDESCDHFYFACCVPSYDPRGQKVARATSAVLKKAGVNFGVIGEQEFCCGEAVRRVGAEKVFQMAMKTNTELFKKMNVHSVITTSPHCQKTFKTEYPDCGSGFTTTHISEFLYELIATKKIEPRKKINQKIVYHDPCTLGRQLGVYDEPRAVLKSITGVQVLDVPVFNREFSVCCGAGAMGLWRDWPQDERLATYRIGQLLNTGADVIAVACPYCLQMFEETLKSMGNATPVMDITEILAVALDIHD